MLSAASSKHDLSLSPYRQQHQSRQDCIQVRPEGERTIRGQEAGRRDLVRDAHTYHHSDYSPVHEAPPPRPKRRPPYTSEHVPPPVAPQRRVRMPPRKPLQHLLAPHQPPEGERVPDSDEE